MTTRVKNKLDELIYVWNGKIAGRVMLMGVIFLIASPFFEKIFNIKYKDAAIFTFGKAGPGLICIATGLVWYAIRSFFHKWDGSIRRSQGGS